MAAPDPQVELLKYFAKLGPNAKHILLRLAQRMAKGADQYGDFPIRSWKREAAEEALDMCVYLTAELELEPEQVKPSRPRRNRTKTKIRFPTSKKTSSRASH